MKTVDARLPARPSLEFLKKSAKQQVAALRRQGKATSLAAVQLTLARKYGFPSWRKLKAHVELLEQAAAAVEAISNGDTKSLKQLLNHNSNLANTRVDDKRTLLHIATDWPGHFPNNMETIAALVASGADVNAAFTGRHSETPLHWAASSNDVGVIDVLLDHGANIEAPGSVIGGGTPMSDAVAFGQWQAARRLVERGARTTLWQAAALGLMDRVGEYFKTVPTPTPDEITNAFWCACHGGQSVAAEYLFDRGANLNWVGYDRLSPLDAANRSGIASLVQWLRDRGAKSAKESAVE
jgi:ankyrin repeat protein